ncbi:MAG TPA: DUF362 domain-containing protein [Bacteroidales bacterium]|nr:DUF362 domain-containing protein [Bacteroidales bacterium]
MKTEKKNNRINITGTLNKINNWLETKHIPPRVVFFIMGIVSTAWFLIRVVPKPSRATYPCVQAAAPIMSGFILYLLSLGGITVTLRRTLQNITRAKYIAAGSMLVAGLVFLTINLTSDLSVSSANENKKTGPDDGPKSPFGTGNGINQGRVIWAWNPDATNENCKNIAENYDWYFNPVNADQKVIGNMFSESIVKISGNPDLKQSWDALFRYHNLKKYKKEKGYTKGEKIFIKINQGTASWSLSKDEINNGYTITTSPQTGKSRNTGAAETSQYIVLELLRELVNVAGISQSDISVGDPIAHIFGHNYSAWHAEFPDVVYIDRFSDRFNRTLIKQTEKNLVFYSDKKQSDKLYDIIENADYMINVASLKPHGSAGVSLTAKNHFGSQGRPSASHLHYALVSPTWESYPREVGKASNGGYKKYRVLVDLMGSRYLGQNTMLYVVDGLFGGGADETKGPVKYLMAPFNDDWSNSIFLSQDQVALESVCYDFLRSEWNGINKHNKANNIFEEGPNMFGVDDYLHQAADSKNWPEGIIYDPDNSGKPLPSLGVHEHWNNAADKQYSGNLGIQGGITLVSIPDTLVKRKL